MKNVYWKEQNGLTLLELMIAMLFFTVGIMAVSSMLVTSIKSNSKAHKGVCDAVVASRHLEQILAMSYDDALLTDTDNGDTPLSPDHGPFCIAATRSTIEWEIAEDYPAPNTKKITVTIRGPAQGGVENAITIAYVKSRNYCI